MDQCEYQIKMFGGFSIQCGGRMLEDSAGRMQQVWNLLEYLLLYRARDISQEALIELLWPDEQSDNPANALKNLAYRLRGLLTKAFPEEKRPFIIYNRGSYCWNRELACTLDVDRFESCIRRAENTALPQEERAVLLCRACEIYAGLLLPKSSREQWTFPMRAYYHQLYVKAVSSASEWLMEEREYDRVIELTQKAISLEPYEESLHELLIRALAAAGKHTAALEHYYYVTNLFYDELGVKVSANITRLYHQIAKSVSHVASDLSVIEENLHMAAQHEGAFFCDYETFKSIYASQSCLIGRSGQSMYVVLMTVCNKDGSIPETEPLTRAMDMLKEVAVSALRKSDIVTRFSPTQYILLLSNLNYENCEMVLKRISDNFQRRFREDSIEILSTQCPVTPVR